MEEAHMYQNTVDIDGVKVTLQELPNTTDHRTMGEIEDDEKAQCEYAMANLKDHRFLTKEVAIAYIDECFMFTLKRLGVSVGSMTGGEFFQKVTTNKDFEKKLYKNSKVRVSRHRRSQEDEFWQAGLYVYKGDELAAFIGEGDRVTSEIIFAPPFYIVRTNVSLPGGKGFIN